MMIRLRSFSCVFILCLLSFAIKATEFEKVSNIQQATEAYLKEYYQGQVSQDNRDIDIKVNNLDSRLHLSKCDKPLTFKPQSQGSRNGRITVKASCPGLQPWSLFISALVEISTEVAVATRSLARGSILQSEDVRLEKRNITTLGSGVIEDMERLSGMELKRSASAGDPIRLQYLKQPVAIKRGDNVTVEATSGAIAVVTPGIALADGRVGQQIRIRNTKTERVIKAKVISQSKVRVSL